VSDARAQAPAPDQAAQPRTVHLRRLERVEVYRELPDIQWGDRGYAYMDAADTTLDARHPDDNFGGSRTLTLSPGESDTVLLRFGQLNRAISRRATITDVKLVLHPVAGRFTRDVPVVIRRMQTEWRDGGADGRPMYWTATHNAAMGSDRGNAIAWQRPGARGAADRRNTPSLLTNTSVGYNPATNTWTITGPGLLDDVRYWFDRQHRNFGWALEMSEPLKALGPVELHSSDVMEKALRPELVVTFTPDLTEGPREGVDLNVAFISRTPRYLRYNDNGVTTYERKRYRDDNPGIMKFPDNEKTKKWPDVGEVLTYTAHVKNSGSDRYRGPVDWIWTWNGKTLTRGTLQVDLAPEQQVTHSIKLPWKGDLSDIRDEKLVFEIDPSEKIAEITKNNNAEYRYVKARTWKYWVERDAYEYAKQWLTAYGSYSFEDYLKWHEDIWNHTFLERSRFDGLAPDGSTQRIALDDFEIVPTGRLGGGIHRLDDKPDFHFDGEWGTEWLKGDQLTNPDAVMNAQNFLRAQRIFLEGSLIHEASHQVLGAFDIYWSNIEPATLTQPGKQHAKDGGEHYITRGDMYAFGGLMGGDDTRPNEHYTEGTGLYSAHTVMGLNSNTPYRNGFYGEWQYDLPRSISVRLVAADGSPIPSAKVKVWQFSGMKITDENVVAEGLVADAGGVLKLPDQDSLEAADYTTITGHTMLKKNPFGRIEVVGSNTVLMLKVEGYDQVDYRFIRIADLNRAYWKGYKNLYTHDVRTQISPVRVDWSANLAQGRPVQTPLNAPEAARITDGDAATTWNGGAAPAGSYVQVDLGAPVPVAAVRFVQSAAHGQFFPRFRIEVSNDASFRTGVTEINRQFPYSFAKVMSDDRDIDPADPNVRWATYGARPTAGRYLRVTSLEDTGGVAMSEIRVYGPAQ